MAHRFEKLMEPGQIGRVRTRNRIIKTANGTSYMDEDQNVGPRQIAYYERLAKGGVGYLTVESCGVEYPLGIQHVHYDADGNLVSARNLTLGQSSRYGYHQGTPHLLSLVDRQQPKHQQYLLLVKKSSLGQPSLVSILTGLNKWQKISRHKPVIKSTLLRWIFQPCTKKNL